MDIIDFRNAMTRYVDFVLTNDRTGFWAKNETDIMSLIIWFTASLWITLFVVWWLVPLRYLIYYPLTHIKFKKKER